MSSYEKAIDAAYQNKVSNIYHQLFEAILLANGDQVKIESAKKKYKDGLDLVNKVRNIALDIQT